MRNSRDRWAFFPHPQKPALKPSEVSYFKRLLKQVLKVGIEIEMNLPDKNGSCRGNNTLCPCKHIKNNDCWTKCAHLAKCQEEKDYSKCAVQCINCEPEDCATCSHFELKCEGMFCPNFMPHCYICDKFEIDCNSCPDKYDPERNPENIRRDVANILAPNNCYGVMNESGVHSIQTDGSLLGENGIEVVTIGRRVDYWEFYKMLKKIIDTTVAKGGYMNERCSIHQHVLASYYSKLFNLNDTFSIPHKINELERPLPEVVMSNFHQLVRRYQNALCWLSMGLDDPNRMTRWEKFRVSVLNISAITNSMKDVVRMVFSNAGDKKYGLVNYKYSELDEEGNTSRFHIEMREMDGIQSPSIIAAMACLHYALVIKAVEISKYGIVEIEDSEWMEHAVVVKDSILNNMKNYNEGDRFGNTRNLKPHFDYLITESLDLIRQLKHILIQVGPAYQVLEKLALKPAALRRCEGDSWEKIEADVEVPASEEDLFSCIMSEMLDLRIIDDCENMDDWIVSVSEALVNNPDVNVQTVEEAEERVRKYVQNKKDNGDIIWSTSLGAMVSL
jgi:hypothetical protein